MEVAIWLIWKLGRFHFASLGIVSWLSKMRLKQKFLG